MSLLGAKFVKSFVSLSISWCYLNYLQYHLEASLSIHIEIFDSSIFPCNMQKVMLMQFNISFNPIL
jgi:hypothetical protein